MFRSIKSLVSRVLFASLLTVCATVANAQSATNPDAATETQVTAPQTQTLEQLLEQSGFMYKKIDGNKYRVMVEGDGQVSAIVCYEGVAYKNKDGVEVKIVYMYRWLADLPEGTEPSVAITKKVNEWNDKAYVGCLIINQYGIYNADNMWLATCSVQNFSDQLYFLHYDGLTLEKEFKALVGELTEAPANAG